MVIKIKKFDIEKLYFEVESNHPLLARLVVLSKMYKFVKIIKFQPTVNGKAFGKPFFRLYIASVRYMKGGD